MYLSEETQLSQKRPVFLETYFIIVTIVFSLRTHNDMHSALIIFSFAFVQLYII